METNEKWGMLFGYINFIPTLLVVLWFTIVVIGIWCAKRIDKEYYNSVREGSNPFTAFIYELFLWTWSIPLFIWKLIRNELPEYFQDTQWGEEPDEHTINITIKT